jgi:hypothetical protein
VGLYNKKFGVCVKKSSLIPVMLDLVDYFVNFAQTLMILGNIRATEFGTLAGF